jgi:3-hydroxyisobutyrate dehydrogenase-like beta-hydroxyacid dehydrogenase
MGRPASRRSRDNSERTRWNWRANASCVAFSEGLLLAERDGIDRRLAATVLSESAIGSPMLRARVPLVLEEAQ